jgi:Bacterial mobilisation protein (MobC)
MTDDLVPRMPSPNVRFHFRRAAKELCNRNPGADVSDKPVSKEGATTCNTEGSTPCITKSSAQVAPFVIQKGGGGLKPGCHTQRNTRKASQSKPFSVRLTQEQIDSLKERAEDEGCSVNEYVRNVVLDGNYRSPLPPDVYRELLACKLELTRQGNNLNQIARQLNAGLIDDDEALYQLNELAPSLLMAHATLNDVLTNGRTED